MKVTDKYKKGLRIPYPENWKLPPCYACKNTEHFVHKNASGYFQIVCTKCFNATQWRTKEQAIIDWFNTYLYGQAYLSQLKREKEENNND